MTEDRKEKKGYFTYQSGVARDIQKFPYGVEYMLAWLPVERSSKKDQVYFGEDLTDRLEGFIVVDGKVELYAEMGPCHEDHDYREGMYYEQLKAEIRDMAAVAGIDPDTIKFSKCH